MWATHDQGCMSVCPAQPKQIRVQFANLPLIDSGSPLTALGGLQYMEFANRTSVCGIRLTWHDNKNINCCQTSQVISSMEIQCLLTILFPFYQTVKALSGAILCPPFVAFTIGWLSEGMLLIIINQKVDSCRICLPRTQ